MFEFLSAFVKLEVQGLDSVIRDAKRVEAAFNQMERNIVANMSAIESSANQTFSRVSSTLQSLGGTTGSVFAGAFGGAAVLKAAASLRFLATIARTVVAGAFRVATVSVNLFSAALRLTARAVGTVVSASFGLLRRALLLALSPTVLLFRELSRLRTILLLIGTVYIRRFAESLSEARVQIENIQAQFRLVFGLGAANQIDRVRRLTDELGTNFQEAATAFGKLAFSGQQVGISLSSTETLFRGVNEAVIALGLNSEQANSAFLAFQQIVERGTVSAEELRRQLGNAGLPAVALAARALGISIEQLNVRLREGSISSRELVDALGPELRRQFSFTARLMARFGTQARLNRLQNQLFDLRLELSRRLTPAFQAFQARLLKTLNSPEVLKFIRGLTDQVARLFDFLANSGAVRDLFAGVVSQLRPTVSLLSRTTELLASLLTLINVSVFATINQLVQRALPLLNAQLERVLRNIGGVFGVRLTGLRGALNLIGQVLQQASLLGEILATGFQLAVNRFRSVLQTLFAIRGAIFSLITEGLTAAFLTAIQTVSSELSIALFNSLRGANQKLKAVLLPVIVALDAVATGIGDQSGRLQQAAFTWSLVTKAISTSATRLDAAGEALSAKLAGLVATFQGKVASGFNFNNLVDGARGAFAEIQALIPESFKQGALNAVQALNQSAFVQDLKAAFNFLRGGKAGIGQEINQAAEKIRISFLDGAQFFQRLQTRQDTEQLKATINNTNALEKNTKALKDASVNNGQACSGSSMLAGAIA